MNFDLDDKCSPIEPISTDVPQSTSRCAQLNIRAPISSACVSVPRAMSSLQKLNGNRYDYPAEIALAIMFGWPKISVC